METTQILIHILVPVFAIILSIVGAMITVAVMWGKVNQIVTNLLNRVGSVEKKQDLISGNTEGAAVTVAHCNNARGNCSQMICGKLDDLKKSLYKIETKREEGQKEIQDVKIQIAKIAQCIDDYRANGEPTTKRWTNGGKKDAKTS